MRTIGRIGEPLRAGTARRAPKLSVRREGTAAVAMRRRLVPKPVLWAIVLIIAGLSYLGFAVDRATGPAQSESAPGAVEPDEIRAAADSRPDRTERDSDAAGAGDPEAATPDGSGPDGPDGGPIDPDAVAAPPESASDDGNTGIDPDAPALPREADPSSG